MSSWSDYIAFIKQGNKVEHAHIIGKDDGSVWATDSDSLKFNENYTVEVTSEKDPDKTESIKYCEKAALWEGFENNGIVTSKGGIRIDNEKYFSVKFDPERAVWYLKKNQGGACVAFTNKCVLIGTYCVQKQDDTGKAQNPGDCNKAVEDTAKYLLSSGY